MNRNAMIPSMGKTAALSFFVMSICAGFAAGGEVNWETGITPGQAIILATEADKLTDSPAAYIFALYRFDRLFAGGLEMGQSLAHKRKGKMTGAEVGDINNPPDGRNDA